MNSLIRFFAKFRFFRNDLDYHLLRTTMVIIFLFFGYQKWFHYEAQALIPYISHGPLIFWMYPVFGIRGATYFLGVSEWTFAALLLAGFWNKRLGILGALGSCGTFIATSTIIPFMPDGWAASAGGFPAMTEHVAFLMKDLVLFAVSFYLLKEDLFRAALAKELASNRSELALTLERQPDKVSVAKLMNPWNPRAASSPARLIFRRRFLFRHTVFSHFRWPHVPRIGSRFGRAV